MMASSLIVTRKQRWRVARARRDVQPPAAGGHRWSPPLGAVALLAVGLHAAVAPARAQAADTLDVLAPPRPVMMCQSLPPTPEDSAAVVLQFLDGVERPLPRKSLVAFDSAGTPLYATIIAAQSTPDGGHTVHGVGVRFFGADRGGTRVIASRGPRDSVATRADSVSLTDAEVARARELAVWLWNRRCGRQAHNR